MLTRPKITLTHGATVLDIVEHALTGDTVKARAYTELLLERLEANDDDVAVRRLKAILNGDDKGPVIKPAGEDNQ
jgi:Tfp pilus assembly protein PilF